MNDFKELLARYLHGQLTSEEVGRLMTYIQEDEAVLPEEITALLTGQRESGTGDPVQEELLFSRIMSMDQELSRKPVYRRMWWAAAAGILVLLGAAGYFWHQQNSPVSPKHPTVAVSEPDTKIPAGSKGAILTLSNGENIALDSTGSGTIAIQNGVKVALDNGQLQYQPDSVTTSIVFNTLSTPRGREFRIVLPDGSKAWLNSASSIKYPAAFSGKERSVEITGEVYFEIASDANMPFRVKVNRETTIDVLGTHFNINAYPDEKNIAATLAEGAIRFNLNEESTILSPGQQARVPNQSAGKKHIHVTANADVAQVLAWKDGLFDFNHMPFDQVMRQLSRWYDIDVTYESAIPDIDFEGTLGRDVSLSKILFFLGKVGVQYRLEGRRLVISQ